MNFVPEMTTEVNTPTKEEFNMETHYEALGNFREEIPKYLKDVLAQKEAKKGVRQESSFYLNSSDSLETLLESNFSGSRVLTVSGSGEFSHAFINGGASEVCCFDISPAAAFYSELRHISLCTLEMNEYIELFGGWIKGEGGKRGAPFINKVIYQKVQDHLSEEARVYFSSLFQTPKLINYTGEDSWYGFSRLRMNNKTRCNRVIGDLISQEGEYKALQEKAKKVKFTQVICDVSDMEDLVKSYKPGLIYISNIGYRPNVTVDIAKKYIDAGVKEVMCTISSNESEFNDPFSRRTDSYDNFYYDDKLLSKGTVIPYTLYNRETGSSQNVPIEIVGTDKNADYGLTLKLIKPK
jgi:hypothetical protein